MISSITNAQDTLAVSEDLQLIHLGNSNYIHLSYHEVEPWGRIASNGLVVIRNGEAVLIDTPMDEEKTAQLYNYVKDSLGANIKLFIPGHFHEDCVGGLAYLHTKGVVSRGGERTSELLADKGMETLMETFRVETSVDFNGTEIMGWYPGPGHTGDNIVIYIRDAKILFGGCLVRSKGAKSMGNTADADLEAWGHSLKNVLNRFPDAELVVPGHGKPGGKDLILHSIELWKEFRQDNR